MNKDLEFIATHLKKWPDDDVGNVFVDGDGEIHFDKTTVHNFYPIGIKQLDFEGDQSYSKQEWEDARKTITNKNNSVLFHEQLDELLKQHFGDNTGWFCHIKVGKYRIDLSCNEVSDD